MKKIKNVFIIMFGILIFLIIAIPIAITISNDYAAKEVAKRIVNVPLPEQTEYIESAYLAGKLTGNGNGMQYFGAVLVKSDLSTNELTAYYQNYAENKWEYIVEHQETEEIQVIEHGQLSFINEIEGDNYYMIYSWGDNNEFAREFDLRGH